MTDDNTVRIDLTGMSLGERMAFDYRDYLPPGTPDRCLAYTASVWVGANAPTQTLHFEPCPNMADPFSGYCPEHRDSLLPKWTANPPVVEVPKGRPPDPNPLPYAPARVELEGVVWMVQETDYDSQPVHGIFTTAGQAMARYPGEWGRGWAYAEWELDDLSLIPVRLNVDRFDDDDGNDLPAGDA